MLFSLPAAHAQSGAKSWEGICLYIGELTENPAHDGEHYWGSAGVPLEKRTRYLFELRFLQNAGVAQNDPEETLKRKLRALWDSVKNDRVMKCNNMQFSVVNGSILKFVVSTKFNAAFDDVIDWGLDLNVIDASDNKTLLDYTEEQYRQNEGKPIAKKLREYVEDLRAAGAKRRSELP